MRGVLRIPIGVLLSALASLGVARTDIARAEVTEAQILSAIETARRSGARISEQEVQNILKTFREQMTQRSQMQEELGWQERGPVFDLEHPLSHSKSAEGIPFVPPSQVVFPPQPTEVPGETPRATPAPVWSPEPYQRPSACAKNETKRIEYDSKGDDSVTYVDRLFVREDLVPIDSGEVYGPKVDLIPYGPNESNATMVRMSIYRVPCVPYRMRMTGKAEYIDTGVNALKNYTSNPAGKGVLHPFVEEKLNPEKYYGKGPTRPQRR